MKKSSALQYALVITGIILGYQAFQTLLIALLSIMGWLIGGNTYFGLGIREFILLACYALASWFLIMRSHTIAGYISRNTSLNEGFSITTKATSLLQIVLIAIGMYCLLASLPLLLNDLLDGLRVKSRSSFELREPLSTSRFLYLIQTIVAVLAVAFSKPLAAFLANHITDDTITLFDDTDNTHPTNRNRQQL